MMHQHQQVHNETTLAAMDKVPPQVTSISRRRSTGTAREVLGYSNNFAMKNRSAARRNSVDLDKSKRLLLAPRSDSITHALVQGTRGSLSQIRVNSDGSLSQGLVGREKELSILRGSYDRARENQMRSIGIEIVATNSSTQPQTVTPPNESKELSSEFLLITGHAGTGKSLLASAIRPLVKRTGGMFVSGKYDQRKLADPFSAISSAFNQLCDEILCEPNNQLRERMVLGIRDALGSDFSVLTELLPNLGAILEATKYHKDGGGWAYDTAKNRFNFFFRRLVQAISSVRPLVLCLDDLQWADSASLELIEIILTDDAIIGLLVIGTYREESIHSTNLFSKFMQVLRDAAIPLTTVSIGDLDVGAVNGIVSNTLTSSKEKTINLAKIIHKKTNGNAFFVVEFLRHLRDEGLLTFNVGTFQWDWDEEVISFNTAVTNNVADIMRGKLTKMEPESIALLQVAACLGSSFDSKLLCLLSEAAQEQRQDSVLRKIPSSSREVMKCLHRSVEDGLLNVDKNSKTFSFVHDHVQQSAYCLLPENHQNNLQIQIGHLLVQKLSEEDMESTLFIVVDLCNLGDLSVQELPGLSIAMLQLMNLRAGQKALKASAFELAANYLRKGIKLLDEKCWENCPDLSLELFSTLIEVDYINGSFKELKNAIDHVLSQDSIAFQDKFRVYSSYLCTLQAEQHWVEATDVGIHVLNELGMPISKNPSKGKVAIEFMKMKKALKGHTAESLSNLPQMTDQKRIDAMWALTKLFFSSFKMKSNLLPVVIFTMVRWSLTYGVCKHSPTAFSLYALILCSKMQKPKEGCQFGKLAISLAERQDAKDVEPRVLSTVYGLVSHWHLPIQSTLKPLLRVYRIGMERGEIESASTGILFYCSAALHAGRPLPLVEMDMKTYSKQMGSYKQEFTATLFLPSRQYTWNLMGKADNPAVLSGAVMDKETLLEASRKRGDNQIVVMVDIYQSWLAYYFDKLEVAASLYKKTWEDRKELPSITGWRHVFYCGLIASAMCRLSKKKIWKRRMQRAVNEIHKYVEMGNMNCGYMEELLEAEKARVNGNSSKAQSKYNSAIRIVMKSGFVQDAALANELAGEYFVESNVEYWAKHHISKAHQLYMDWGAHAKASHLARKYRHLMSSPSSE